MKAKQEKQLKKIWELVKGILLIEPSFTGSIEVHFIDGEVKHAKVHTSKRL